MNSFSSHIRKGKVEHLLMVVKTLWNEIGLRFSNILLTFLEVNMVRDDTIPVLTGDFVTNKSLVASRFCCSHETDKKM